MQFGFRFQILLFTTSERFSTKTLAYLAYKAFKAFMAFKGSWLVYDDLTDVIGYLPSSPITVGT